MRSSSDWKAGLTTQQVLGGGRGQGGGGSNGSPGPVAGGRSGGKDLMALEVQACSGGGDHGIGAVKVKASVMVGGGWKTRG